MYAKQDYNIFKGKSKFGYFNAPTQLHIRDPRDVNPVFNHFCIVVEKLTLEGLYTLHTKLQRFF